MTDAGATPAARDDAIAQLVSVFAANGFPRMPASVLMALMTSEEGSLSAEELASTLGVSAGAVSGAVRYLSTTGMVRTRVRPGSRRHVYELPDSTWYTASISKNDLYLHLQRVALEAAEGLTPRAAARLEEMGDFFGFLAGRIPSLLQEWRETRPE